MPHVISLCLQTLRLRARWRVGCILAVGALLNGAFVPAVADTSASNYDIPEGKAIKTLKLAAKQGDVDIMFAASAIKGVTTSAIEGVFTAQEALDGMLAETSLFAVQDEGSGAFAIVPAPKEDTGDSVSGAMATRNTELRNTPVMINQNRKSSNVLKAVLSLTAMGGWLDSMAQSDDVVELSPFTVESSDDFGYRKTNAMTATKIGTSILETPLNISVISRELLDDLAVENSVSAFSYTSGVMTNYDSATSILPPGADGGVKIRGFGTSFVYQDGVRRFSSFHIDGMDRTEVVKGPVGLYFGRSDPGGIINFVSKKPNYIDRTVVKLTTGNDSFFKGVVDHQGVLSENALAYRVTLSKRDGDDWLDSVSWDEEYFLGSIAWRPTEKVDVLFQYEDFDQSKTGGTVPAIVANSRYLAAADNGSLIIGEDGRAEGLGAYGQRIFAETGEDIRTFDSYYFPNNNFAFNRNGPGAFDNNTNETFSIISSFALSDNLDFRLTYVDNQTDGEISWFINQDPHQAPNTMAAFGNNGDPNCFTCINYGFFISPSFAPDGSTFSPGRQADVHDYETIQADLSYNFNALGGRHTLIASFETIDDSFTQYGFLTDRDAFIAAGGIPGGVSGFGDDNVSDASNQILMQRRQQLVDWGLIGEEDRIPGRGGPWSSLYVDVTDPNAQIPNMADFIGNRTVRSRSGSDSTDRGISLAYQGKFLEDRLQFLAGVRKQEYDVIDASVNTEGVRSTSGQELNFEETVFTAGANFEVSDRTFLYASYSENFVPSRSANDVWENRDTGATVGGDRVDPQIGEGIEIGIKTNMDNGKVSGTLSLFNLKRANIDIQDLARGEALANENELDGDPDNGPWFNQDSGEPAGSLRIPSFRFAGGEQEVEGGEAEVIFTPNENFQAIVFFNYFWTAEWTRKDPSLINVARGGLYTGNFGNDGRDAIPDRMENVPDLNYGFWGSYSFTEGVMENWKFGFGGNYAAEQIHEVRTNFNPYVTGDWWRFDAMAQYQFGDVEGGNPWKAQLNISNLFDEEYITGSFGISPTREWKLSLRKAF